MERNDLAILVEGPPRNISAKLFHKLFIGLEGDVVNRFFYFFALTAILFSVSKQF